MRWLFAVILKRANLDLLKWGLLSYFTKDPVHAKRPCRDRRDRAFAPAALHCPG
jgi:hypothetical protein